MNQTSTPPNNLFQLVQQSVLAPVKAIFDQVSQQMSAIGKPALDDDSAAPAKPAPATKPQPAEGGENQAAPRAGIDFSLNSLKQEKALPKGKVIKLNALSPKAVSLFQQQLGTIQKSFAEALDKQFKTALAPPARKETVIGQRMDKSANIEHLSLVSNEELEMQIVLIHAESALLDTNQDQLILLCMRFEHVLKREMLATRLPIGPIAIGHAFLDAIITLDIAVDEKKLILQALLESLKTRYDAILQKANSIFIQNNILPNISEEDSRMRRKKDETRALAKEKRQKLLGISEEKAGDTVAVSSELARFIADIKIPEGAEQHFVKGKANAPAISTKELASKIDLLKSVPPKAADNGVYFEPDTSGKTLAELLNSEAKLSEVGLAKDKANTIGIMSMLFENLLTNENIPGPIKALLQQMRAPMLKAAVQDQMFFGDTENPAQKFFNDIAQASLSWTPSKNPETDTLYKKMSSLVSKINNNFEDDYLIFDDAIEDLDSFTEAETKKTSRIEERTVGTEVAQVRHKTAKEVSQAHIEEKFADPSLPAEIRNFFQTTWQQVLFFIFNKTNSVTSEEWLDAIEVENSLLANLSGAEEDEIDLFLDILKEKLADSGIQQFEIKKQLAMIKKTMLEKNQVKPEVIENIKSIKTDVMAKIMPQPTAQTADEEAEKISKALHVGTWLQKNNVTPILKIKVAAHIKFNDSYVMVLRNGAKEGTYTRADLIQKIRANELKILENPLVFDSALESVIGGIR